MTVQCIGLNRTVGFPGIRVFFLEGAALAFSFAAAAFSSDQPAYLQEPQGFLRLAVPVSVGLAVLLFRNIHARRSERKQYDSTLDVVLAFGFAFLVEALLRRYSPWLALTRGWAPTQGGLAGMLDLAASRALFGPNRTQDELKPDTLQCGRGVRRDRAFLTAAYWVIMVGVVPGTVVILWGSQIYAFFVVIPILLVAEVVIRRRKS